MRLLLAFVLLSLLSSSLTASSVLLHKIGHVKQRPDFCGEACVEMYLRSLGYDISQDDVFGVSGLDPILGRGCYTKELVKAVVNLGMLPGRCWHTVSATKSRSELNKLFVELLRDLKEGVPSIVCTRFDESPGTTEHFRLVIGYDKESDSIIYQDPALSHGHRLKMTRKRFFRLWPLHYSALNWTVIRIALRPKLIYQPKKPRSHSLADYAQHMRKTKKLIPRGFHVVFQPPFIVIGDESPQMVKRRAQGTVKWATDKLKEAFFAKDPSSIIDVWLFKDKRSYDHHTRTIFGDYPDTPFGYFSPSQNALVMNIATGGGTLVHEIVHPLVAANFPHCPAWLNEGMGSLYEQCGERGGKIVGFTNWRLSGLQQTIRKGLLDSFYELCHTTTPQFYGVGSGTNYAQARYLCYYLQQKGLLRTYYHSFLQNRQKDPSGYETLKKVLKIKDIRQFDKQWQRYVLSLRFP